MKYLSLLSVVLGLSSSAFAASFDCAKAGSSVEKLICQDGLLNKLDEALGKNYSHLMKSASSDAEKKDLRDRQRSWFNGRNKCANVSCLVEAYKDRLDDMCPSTARFGKDPSCLDFSDVESAQTKQGTKEPPHTASAAIPEGVSPRDREEFEGCMAKLNAIPAKAGNVNPVRNIACMIDNNELRSRYHAAEEKKLTEIASAEAAESKQALASAKTKHSAAIKALGFSSDFLNGTIYLQTSQYNRPTAYAKFGDWLAMLFDSGNYSNITKINSGQAQGVLLKRPGTQSAGLLFVLDDGDIFPSHVVSNNKAQKLQSIEDQMAVTMLMSQTVK